MTKVKALLLERVRSRAALKSMTSRLCQDSLNYASLSMIACFQRLSRNPTRSTGARNVGFPSASFALFPPILVPARWHIISDHAAISASGDLGGKREGKDEKEAEMRLVML